jgi:hypothetical protein
MPGYWAAEKIHHLVMKRKTLNRFANSLGNDSNRDAVWLDKQEVLQKLKISARTLQTLRDNELITFSRLGGKIFYPLCEINRVLLENIEVIGRKKRS